MIRRRTASRHGRPDGARSGTIVLELLMALPVLVITADYIIDLTFDAAFMTGLSVAATEAAREAAQAFPSQLPAADPQGEPNADPSDLDDIADRVALAAEQRLRLLKLRVRPAIAGRAPSLQPGVRVILRRGNVVCERGDTSIPYRSLRSTLYPGDVEVILAARLPRQRTTETAPGQIDRSFGDAGLVPHVDVLQASARATLE